MNKEIGAEVNTDGHRIQAVLEGDNSDSDNTITRAGGVIEEFGHGPDRLIVSRANHGSEIRVSGNGLYRGEEFLHARTGLAVQYLKNHIIGILHVSGQGEAETSVIVESLSAEGGPDFRLAFFICDSPCMRYVRFAAKIQTLKSKQAE